MNIFRKFASSAVNTFIKNKPAVMTGIALVSLGTTVYVALKEGPVIKEALDIHKGEVAGIKEDTTLTEEEKKAELKKETEELVKEIAKPVAKVALATGITAFSIFGINKAHTAKEVAASALLESYKAQILQYEDELPDVLGKEKANEFINKVRVDASEKVSEGAGVKAYREIKYTDKVPFLDEFGSRFVASKDELDRAINYLGRDLTEKQRCVNYSDFLFEYFSDVDINPKCKSLFFDYCDIPSIETEIYEDPILKTPAYHLTYKYGRPQSEWKLSSR